MLVGAGASSRLLLGPTGFNRCFSFAPDVYHDLLFVLDGSLTS